MHAQCHLAKVLCCIVQRCCFLQANQQLREQLKQLAAARDALTEANEAKEAQLFDLHAQVDLLRNHTSDAEAWLATM